MRKTSLALSVLACAVIGPAQAFTFSDDFSGAAPNPFWWTVGQANGNTVSQVGGRIEMSQLNASGWGALAFNFPVIGDFEMQVDYQLLVWPAANFERIGLSGSLGAVERSQHPGWFDEAYVAHFSGVGDGVYPTGTADTSGTLRMVRSGSTLSGDFWDGNGWTRIHSFSSAGVAADASVGLAIWNGYASVPTLVAFDNFRLDAPGMTTPVPEPQTLALWLVGLCAMAGWGRQLRRHTAR